MENTEKGYNDLSAFNWEANPDETDFFGIKATEYQENVDLDKAREKATQPKVENEESTEEPEETTEEQPVFESFTNPDETEETSEDKPKVGRPAKEKESSKSSSYMDQFTTFREKGILKHVELDEGVEDLDEETFTDLVNQDYEEEVSSRIEQWATQELDEDAQAFIKFKKNGGSTEDFFRAMAKNSEGLNGNIEDENFQDKLIRRQLQMEDWDEEEIQARIDHLTKVDKKQSVAEKYYNRIKLDQKKRSEELIKRQQEFKEQAEKSREMFRTNVKETLNSTQEVKGIKITTKDKSSLFNFITKEDQLVGDRYVTGFQRAITEAVQDPEKMVLLAKLLSTGFDMTDLEKKAKIKETQKIKESLESRSGIRPGTSRGAQLTGGKSLSDLWD